MESSVKGSLAGGASKPKPGLAPKPLLTPKPFSLQKKTTIRSIHAPRAVTATSKTTKEQAGKSEAGGLPKPTLTPPAKQPHKQPTTSDSKPSSVSAAAKDQAKTTKDSKAHGENILDSSVRKSEPATETIPPKEIPTSEPIQKVSAIQTNHKAPIDIVVNTEQKDVKKKEDETNNTSVVQKLEETGSESSTANPVYRWSGTRKRLPSELTSKFESGGLPLPPQPSITSYTTTAKDDTNKPESSDPEQSPTTAEPSNRESDTGGLKEDFGEGGSIKRRISLLFDSSSRPEVITKREEPEVINGTGGVKEKIKNWVTEKGPKTENKPQVIPRFRSKSFEPATAPTAEKTPKEVQPPVEPPANGTSSSQAVDPPSKISTIEQPAETPMETSKVALTGDTSLESSRETSGKHIQSKSTEGDVPLRNHIPSMSHTATDKEDVASSEIAQHAPKRDNIKRRSVRFGFVERDDGGPPIILGSPSDSSAEEEEEDNASEDEAEEAIPVSVPVYRRVLQKKDDEEQEQEEKRLKHLEFDKRRTEQIEQARGHLEEERKRKEEEEEEKEKEKARKKEEEDRESERLKEEEMERQRKEECERERLKEEERERERLREEEMERERRMELMRQRQREEERERAKQKEERLKQDLEEREKEKLKKKEEERKEERLREERERQRLREDEKTLSQGHEERRVEGKLGEVGMNKEEQHPPKEEECGTEWVNKTERLRGEEEEREKEKELELMWERKKEEDIERARQKEERLRQEEREKERLREEAEERERERQRRLEEEQKKEEEMERIRKLEKKREEEKREEERRRQKERERVEELERKQQEEKKRAQEMEEERLRQEEREKERLREEAEERERERQRRLEEQQKKEEEMERIRKLEKKREEEKREEERRRQKERERVEELERKPQEERKRGQELEEKLRMVEERKGDGLTSREPESVVHDPEPNLISFDSEDVPLKSESLNSPLAKTHEPTESQIEVLYDDFSVRPPLIDVDFDDFSVKPMRWGSQAKVGTTPVVQSGAADPVKKEEVEVLVPVDVSRWENKMPEQVEKTDSPEPILAHETPEEEEEMEEDEERPEDKQLVSIEVEEEEKEREEEEETQEDEVKEETKQKAQVNSYCTNDEDKDTVALIDDEPGQQNEACERTSGSDSPKPVPDQVPEGSSEDLDSTDFHRAAEPAPFPESSTPLLDTSAQKLKADLGKRRIRTRPSRSFRAGLSPTESPDWRTHDSSDKTEASSKQRESDSEEVPPKPQIVCSPPSTTQRVPMFPGLSPAALIAQLKRRTGGGGAGGGEETEEDKGRQVEESQKEEVALSPTQLPRSPRVPAHLAGAALVLPPLGGTDGGAVSSPAWLKELKSKKRLSQYDSET